MKWCLDSLFSLCYCSHCKNIRCCWNVMGSRVPGKILGGTFSPKLYYVLESRAHWKFDCNRICVCVVLMHHILRILFWGRLSIIEYLWFWISIHNFQKGWHLFYYNSCTANHDLWCIKLKQIEKPYYPISITDGILNQEKKINKFMKLSCVSIHNQNSKPIDIKWNFDS